MKNLFFLFFCWMPVMLWADQAPTSASKNLSNQDSVHLINGEVYSKEEYKKKLPSMIEKSIKESESKNTEVEDGRIIASWKFYTILLAFPVFLLLLFILVFVRGRKNK